MLAELQLCLPGSEEWGAGGRVCCLSEKLEVLVKGIVPVDTIIRLERIAERPPSPNEPARNCCLTRNPMVTKPTDHMLKPQTKTQVTVPPLKFFWTFVTVLESRSETGPMAL